MPAEPETDTAIEVLGIDHVVLRVRNLEASLAFYCGILGCRVERRLDDEGLVQLRAGAALIDLVPVDSKMGRAGGPPPARTGRNMEHLALRIGAFDGEKLFRCLAARGLASSEVARRYGAEGMGPSLYVEDPDGNVIELKGPPDA